MPFGVCALMHLQHWYWITLANSAALNTVQGRGSGSRVSLPAWIQKTSSPVLGTKSAWEAGKAEVASHRLSDFLCFCLQIIFIKVQKKILV